MFWYFETYSMFFLVFDVLIFIVLTFTQPPKVKKDALNLNIIWLLYRFKEYYQNVELLCQKLQIFPEFVEICDCIEFQVAERTRKSLRDKMGICQKNSFPFK